MAAEAAISSLLDVLGEKLIQKVRSLQGVEGKVESLKAELRRMQCFLEDANKKQVEDASVRNWISEIRELALNAGDTIEMFIINVEKANNGGSLKTCISFPKRLHHLDRIGDEIESIQKRLQEIDQSRGRYGITVPDVVAASTSRSQVELRRRLSPWGKDEHLVGIQDDVEKILRESILDEEKKGLSAVVLRGMGGIGKSTLAREIYNHPNVAVRGKFDCRAWVVVSSEFREPETMKQLILEFTSPDNKLVRALEKSTKDEQYLLRKFQEMLLQLLKGKNYFIVLDDVWEKQHWEYLRSVFPNEQDKTSRLLVTTRNKITTKYDQYEHEMKALDLEKSWELLLKKASINHGKCPEELESIGRQIVERCHGLPLAISVSGGLLMETRTKSGWQQFLNQINSYLGGAQSLVSPILELSYQNLSPQLKPCFLCLAFFKEDQLILAQWVVNIWAAQGLIQQEGSSTIDEIGRGYLNELINRSLLQIDSDLTLDDQVQCCRIHDLLREVCLTKAKEEMGLRIVGVASADKSSFKTRHHVEYVREIPRTFSLEQNKHLRSLFLLTMSKVDVRIPSNYWKSFELLKTLNFDGFGLRRLPRSFRLLLGLKYLRIHSSMELQIPDWFDHLKKLEVFDVGSVRFPKAPLEMESLRHFQASIIYGRPMSIDNWINVETLNKIRAQDLVQISSTLTACSRLREFGMRIESEGIDVVSRAIASLGKMTNLVKLHLECNPDLYSLSELKLNASDFPPNLSHLDFAGRFDNDSMEELGKLPNLMYLELWNFGKENGMDWRIKVSHDGFPRLEALLLDDVRGGLRGMDIEEGGMPRLKKLRIGQCPNLGTQNLPEHIIITSLA